METARIIMELGIALFGVITKAFEERDVAKLRKVTDVLNDDDNVLKARAIAALEREKAKEALGV